MMRIKGSIAVAGIILLTAGAIMAARAIADVEVEKDLGSIMHEKLDLAQNVLKGLVLEDFGQIQKDCEKLKDLNLNTQWAKRNSPEYRRFSTEFHWAVDKIQKQAKEENLDAATLGVTQMVVSCVQCHKLVRDGENQMLGMD